MRFLMNKFIKLGAYLVLLAGSLIAFLLFSFAIYFLVVYPEGNMSGKIIASIIIVVIAIASLIITISIFETILETIKIEYELDRGQK